MIEKLIDVPQDNGAKPETIDVLINDPEMGPKNCDRMVEEICYIIDNDHNVAIVSFTLYPEVITQTLKAMLNHNSEKYLNEICVIGGYPSDGKPNSGPLGKEEHIAAAIAYFKSKGIIIERKNTILADDSPRNCKIAKEHGPTVLVPKLDLAHDSSYINEIRKCITYNTLEIISSPNYLPTYNVMSSPMPIFQTAEESMAVAKRICKIRRNRRHLVRLIRPCDAYTPL